MTGYESKRAMAQDKLNKAIEPHTITFHNINSDWVMRITADRRIEVNEGVEVTEAAQKVLDALQNLLKPAQPEQEPKHYLHTWGKDGEKCVVCGDKDWMGTICKKISAPQPEQEPVAWMKASDTEWSISFFEEDGYVPLYTTPPQRPWVDLPDDVMWSADYGGSKIINLIYAKAIQSKLKERNA